MSIDVDLLGKRIRQLRELKLLSISAVAARAEISKSYLAKLERGEVDNPGLKTLQVIATALDVTLADLLTPADEPSPAPSSQSAVDLADFERTLADLPVQLREFVDAKKREGDELPADVIRSLAGVQFRGRRPRTREEWQFLYEAIRLSSRG